MLYFKEKKSARHKYQSQNWLKSSKRSSTLERTKDQQKKIKSICTQTPSSFFHDKGISSILLQKQMEFKYDLEMQLKKQIIEQDEYLQQIKELETEIVELW